MKTTNNSTKERE